ncbi:MAG: formyltetrahydrofolate deformylase [Pseudobdellovibrionaceae bacterium]
MILNLSCQDKVGIVAEVAGFLAKHQCNIQESAQFNDVDSGKFFLRTVFTDQADLGAVQLRQLFKPTALALNMDWQIFDPAQPAKVLICVSKFGHCLQDLLYQQQSGVLPMQIAAVVSNHLDMQKLVQFHQLPYVHLPVTAENKMAQAIELEKVIDQHQPDLVVLARYMQVLPRGLAEKLSGRCINIHHSFLPSFKGAKPYHQAHHHGVKVIGATAHFVTADLDEGPIIDQETVRVNHAHTPDQLEEMGRHLECLVLSRAVKYYLEKRVLLNKNRTVVFT